VADGRAAFIVWGPRFKGRRSIVLAEALGVPEVSFVARRWRRGLLGDPLKYPLQTWRTLRILVGQRPRVVLVQSPPTVATWIAAVYAALTGGSFIIDAHSDAFQRPRWTRPLWLNRLVARRALVTLVTDQHWAQRLDRWGARWMVVPDVPTAYPAPVGATEAAPNQDGFTVMVVNTWSGDEPIKAVIDAAAQLPELSFKVTGPADARLQRLGSLPSNVEFTGFLADADYYALMRRSQTVLCLTTRDHTMQRGACEALSLGRPIVTSDRELLRDYFEAGTVHVGSTAAAIRDGIREMVDNHDRYVAEIGELRARRVQEWESRRQELVRLMAGHPDA
jgi:glycosyltransferase involved in cell wall biosynthesis